MVEVIKKGAYLVDGQIVYADQAQNVASPDEAREKTIAYSILRAHNKGKDPKKMQIKFDALISHDITFVGIIQTAKASGLFMTMVVGGGVMPFIQDAIGRSAGYITSYWLVIAMLLYILYFSIWGSRNVNKDIKVD